MSTSKDKLYKVFPGLRSVQKASLTQQTQERATQAAARYREIAGLGFNEQDVEAFFHHYRDIFQSYLQGGYNLIKNGFDINQASEYQAFRFHQDFADLPAGDREIIAGAIEILIHRDHERGWPNKAMAHHPTLQ